MGRGEERNPRSDNPGATTVKTRRHPFARGSSLLYFRIQEFTVAIQPLSHSIHGLHTLCIPCATTAARYRATSRLAALHFTCVPTRTCRPHYMISHRYGKARFPHYSLASSSPFLSVPIPSSLSISFSIHSSFIPRVLCLLPSVSHWLTLSHSPSLSFSLSFSRALRLSPFPARLLSHVPVFHQRQPINKTPSSKNTVHFPRRRLAATLAP